MAYTPTEWKSGDVITAEKLNNIENGVASAGSGSSDFKITMTYNDSNDIYTLDKSYNDIINALNLGKPVYTIYTSHETNYVMFVEYTQISNGQYIVLFKELQDNTSSMEFFSNSPDELLKFWFE